MVREKELGKLVVTTAGDGYCSRVKREVEVIVWVYLDEDSVRREENDIYAKMGCQIAFDTAAWNVKRDGLMYTDTAVEAQVNRFLQSLGYSSTVWWSELGAQEDTRADFDAGWDLVLEVWPELATRIWPVEWQRPAKWTVRLEREGREPLYVGPFAERLSAASWASQCQGTVTVLEIRPPFLNRMRTTTRFDEILALSKLLAEDRLIATIDVTGKPFHRVTCITRHTGRRDKLILWLEPEGLDDDLETPMADPDC